MLHIEGKYLIKDKHLLPADLVEVMATDTILIYEVLRVMNSVCLFVEDHYRRLSHSTSTVGIPLEMTEKEFIERIYQLIQANKFSEGNIKVLVQYGNGKESVFFYFITHAYPNYTAYQKGVTTDLLMEERLVPQAKIFRESLQQKVDTIIREKKLFEVILVDSQGRITEGSRANIFFIKGKKFYTPKAELVLMGITRQKVFECLAELNFSCEGIDIPYTSIDGYDAAFLTGTSPKVLPVAQIGEQKFSPGHAPLQQLVEAYDNMIEQYLRKFQDSAL